jgi:hypothetical protein
LLALAKKSVRPFASEHLRRRQLLRITVEADGVELRLLLEGRLEEALVLELEKTFAEQTGLSAGRPVIVDLSGLTGMDEAGESSLRKLYEQGATLRCVDVMNTYLVERMAHGPVKPMQAPCRPCHSNETQEIKQMEEKESANRDRF